MKVSILSQRAARGDQIVKLGGKVRPGIKVLTRNASQNQQAVKLYNEGVAKRLKFSEIEKQIKDATGLNNPMYPRNTAFFNVAASDFGMPEIAHMIVEKYGEIRDGDSEKRLYRFPVVFHSDDLNAVYPNEFKRYGGEPGYESHYGEDGNRYCRYLPEVTQEMLAEQRARRIKRPPRREKVIRGLCEPNVCPEFLSGQCKFRGRLHFYIPGIPTTGLLAMETTSEYAAEAIWADLDRISSAFGGIPRSNPNKPGANIFYITKVQEQRTYFDENGKKCVGLQWVPKLQADIDIGTMLTSGIMPQLANHAAPVAWLAAPKGMPEAVTMTPALSSGDQAADITQATVAASLPESTATAAGPASAPQASVDPMDQLVDLLEAMLLDNNVVAAYFDLKLGAGWEQNNDLILSGIDQLNLLRRYGDGIAKKLIGIAVKIADMGVPKSEFEVYAMMKYGKGFTNKEPLLDAIKQELDELGKNNAETVRAYMKAQIENAAAAA